MPSPAVAHADAMTAERRHRPGRFGLRARATVGFGVTGLVVAMALAAGTYTFTRGFLIRQRESTAVRQAYVNARLARSVLRSPNPDVRGFLAGLGGATASNAVLRYSGDWFSTSVSDGRDAVPDDLARLVIDGNAGRQRYRDANGQLHLAVGVAIPAVDAEYFELSSLHEVERTLEILLRALAFGVIAAAIAAAVVGRAAAGRLVRPLHPIADAAERIAGGALDTRLDDMTDPDLHRLADAFNSMAGSLEARIEREARFAADVSHELRSPLAAVAAALEIIDRRREQLPPQVTEAFVVLASKVKTFQQMVLDLLEISRMDAGTALINNDVIDLHHFLERLLALHRTEATVKFQTGAPDRVSGDRRRLAQAVGNILDNGARYAGGVTNVTVSTTDDGNLRIDLEDRGPGIAPDERDAIFGRFARGDAGRRAGGDSGTGLGLALVAEHVGLAGGRVWIEDRDGGGTRFVIELPPVVQ